MKKVYLVKSRERAAMCSNDVDFSRKIVYAKEKTTKGKDQSPRVYGLKIEGGYPAKRRMGPSLFYKH